MTETVIRCSSLSTYPECSRRAAAIMFGPEIKNAGFSIRELPHGAGAIVGTSVHKAAEVALAEKARGGTLPPVNVATDCALDTLRAGIAEGVQYDGQNGATRNLPAAEQQVVSMSRAYHATIAPRIDPIMIEERLEAEIAPGLILSGRADQVEKSSDQVAREVGKIRDLKTSARPGSRSHAPQIGAYSLLVRSNAVIDVQSAVIDSIQRVRPEKHQPNPLTQTVRLVEAETAATSIIRHIADDLKNFREGNRDLHMLPGDVWAFMANPNSMLCGERYCPAWGKRGPHAFCQEWVERPEKE